MPGSARLTFSTCRCHAFTIFDRTFRFGIWVIVALGFRASVCLKQA
ncbi:hypothetical protein EV131_11381 [Rhizobium laguerreae]|uniref:Uncharacterized protein n=1 Tax=Rhizobium laguerreae TaxID=1076926 RepID=A0AAX2QEY3_9HYPH|nr:hypothetical protein EV131_11381 [Rhizobium laguerreae]